MAKLFSRFLKYPVEKFFEFANAYKYSKMLIFCEFVVKNMMKQYDCQEIIKLLANILGL